VFILFVGLRLEVVILPCWFEVRGGYFACWFEVRGCYFACWFEVRGGYFACWFEVVILLVGLRWLFCLLV
jgi:hypothetical protein